MAILIKVLSSGSRANCTYISDGKTNLLIDVGLGIKELGARACSEDIDLSEIDGVLITHEHIDHIKGLSAFMAKSDAPVYVNWYTGQAIERRYPMPRELNAVSNFDQGLYIGSMFIRPFRVSHDAIMPMGYTISSGGEKIGYVTDTGYVPNSARVALTGCETALIESNHDVEMLKNGKYPKVLKQRILSQFGHLSNDACAELAVNLASSGTKNFVLCHLSENNNTPELAYKATSEALKNSGYDCSVAVTSVNRVVTAPMLKVI